MNTKKTGVSMGGSLINTRDKLHPIIKSMNKERNERTKVCLDCDKNKEGWCGKHTDWCYKINYICLGIENPYPEEYKFPKPTKIPKQRNKKKYHN